MTENKRYVAIGVDWVDGFIQDHEDDDDLFSISTVINKLNEQDTTIKELEKENEQLKLEYKELRYANNIYCGVIDKLKKRNNELEKENEQLKKLIHITDGLIEWNTIPQVRREWEKQKKVVWND